MTLEEANAMLAEFGGETAAEKMETEPDSSVETAKQLHPKEEDEDAEMSQLTEIEEEMSPDGGGGGGNNLTLEKKRKD